jgi:DNA-binding Lrp family transcriptional regulator
MFITDSEVRRLWSDSTRIIWDRFRLQVSTAPKRVIVSEETKLVRIGGQFDTTTQELTLTPEAMKGIIPIAGIILRESLIEALPEPLCIESRRDLAFEYARQNLRRDDRALWIDTWKTIPSKRLRANLVYTSHKMMHWMNVLGGDSELDSVVHELVSMARYGKSLNFEEYVDYMTQRTQDIEVGLSRTAVKIIDALLKNQDVTNNELASLVGLSRSWLSTQINRLKRRYVLVGAAYTPFSKIGIRSFHVMLSGQSWDDPTRFIVSCPFLYNVRYILNGPWQVLARLAVPDNHENIRTLDLLSSRLNDIGVAVDISETHSAGSSNSFYHYNVSNQRWEIPWVAMEGWGQRIQDESLDKVMERIDTPAHTTDEYLDEVDVRILGFIHRGIFSARALRSRLAIGQNLLARGFKRLRSAGLIRKFWDVKNIGLVERIALKAADRRVAQILDVWSRELPRVNLRYGERRDLLMIAQLPMGGSAKMMDTIRALKWPLIVSPLGSGIGGSWQFPEHLWDVERQRWQAERDGIALWMDQLHEECETTVPDLPDAQKGRVPVSRRRG